VTSSVAVFEAAIWVKSMYIIKSYWKKKKKKKKYGSQINFIHKSPSKRRFWNGIHSLLMRADAGGRNDTIYCMWRISLLCGPGIVNDVTKIGHAQNIYYQRIVSCVLYCTDIKLNWNLKELFTFLRHRRALFYVVALKFVCLMIVEAGAVPSITAVVFDTRKEVLSVGSVTLS